jgi:hypothetical protein
MTAGQERHRSAATAPNWGAITVACRAHNASPSADRVGRPAKAGHDASPRGRTALRLSTKPKDASAHNNRHLVCQNILHPISSSQCTTCGEPENLMMHRHREHTEMRYPTRASELDHDVFRSRRLLCTIHHFINLTPARGDVLVVRAVLDRGHQK